MTPTTRLGRLVVRGATAVGVVAAAVVIPTAAAQADEIRDMEWHLDHLGMAAAWDITEGSGVVVAVLDTGVDATHPDLGDAVEPGIDLTGSGDGTTWYSDHGTAMAGLIAARGRGGDGIRGIAPAATILPVTINDAATTAEGLRWAADNGADVINVSGGTEFVDDPGVRDATTYALSKDVVVVGSAGNGGGPGIQYPGGYGGVITVSALTKQDELTELSSYGPEVDLAAPGDVVSIAPEASYYQAAGGTSASAAIISGVAALVRAEFPDLDAANVVNRLISTARDIGAPGHDDEFGFGVVDPVAALTADVAEVSENPLGSPDGGSSGEPTGDPTSEPTVSEPATEPPATTVPCATSTGTGPAGPAGSLRLSGGDCGGFAGISPGSSNNALGVVVAIGIGAVILVGVAVLFLRRRRPSRPVAPAMAYGGPAVPPHNPGPAPNQGGWQAPPASGNPNSDPGGWQAPPGGNPPPSR